MSSFRCTQTAVGNAVIREAALRARPPGKLSVRAFALGPIYVLLCLFVSSCLLQAQITYYVFKVNASVPIAEDVPASPNDHIVRKTLLANDITNLALGRPLKSTVNPKTEVLAVATTFETSGTTPVSKLIVFNPQQSTVTTTVATLSSLNFGIANEATISAGQGLATGNWLATGGGTGSGFFANTFNVGGTGSGPHGFNPTLPNFFKLLFPTAKAFYQGQMHFQSTDPKSHVVTAINGYVTNGIFGVAGHGIGTFTQ